MCHIFSIWVGLSAHLQLKVLFPMLVRRHSSKIQANYALFDTSMKFGILIAVTNTSIGRHTAKLDVHWYLWKPQFVKIHEIPPFTLVYQEILSFHLFQLVYQICFVLVYGTLPLTSCSHGNEKLKIKGSLRLFDGPLVG